MKKTITFLTLASLFLVSVQLFAGTPKPAELATILVVYDTNNETVSLAEDQNTQQKIHVKKFNKDTYYIYYNIDSIYLKPHINGKEGTEIAKIFLGKTIALEKNKDIRIYGEVNGAISQDTDNKPHQLACTSKTTQRQDYIKIVTKNPTCVLQYNNAKKKINIHFIRTADSIPNTEVICNFFSDGSSDSKMKNQDDKEFPTFKLTPEGKEDSIKINWEKIDHFELVCQNDSLLWSQYRVLLDNVKISPVKGGETCKYKFQSSKENKSRRILTIELDRYTVNGPQKYKATRILESPSSNYIWLYITCAVISLCLIAVGVYFIVKIIKKRITRRIKGKESVSNEDDAEIQELLTKITHRVRELKLENIHDSEQIKKLKELEERLKNNASQICVSFEDNSNIIQKLELIINELTNINKTIDAKFKNKNLKITDTAGNDKLKNIFNVLETQINKIEKEKELQKNEFEERLKERDQKHKKELTQKQNEIDKLNSEIKRLSLTIENACKSITDSISAQLNDISNGATQIQKKLSSDLITLLNFKYITADIMKMSESISDVSAESIYQLNDNLLEVIKDNMIDNGWIDSILRLYTISLYPDINVYFNEQGFDTTLLSELSMKIISLLGRVGITLNIPMLFTRFDDNKQKHATNEEYLKSYCSGQQHIIEHINNLKVGYINDVLHIGYDIPSKQISVKATVNYKK